MKPFMDKDFLLNTETARVLFHDYAAKMPIIDYHCHINPREIAEDKRFENIAEVWLGGDHYKWRLMRSAGVEERYITGDASPREKFQKWAETIALAIGNPLYHWSHLELQRYFGYNGILNGDTAEEVWNLCNEKLAEESMSARGIIKSSGVKLICTTDDPVDSLEWHDAIAADDSFDTAVLPAWRPDKAMNIEKSTFAGYIAQLSEVSGIAITDFATLCAALRVRMDHFSARRCVISDHGLEYVMYTPADDGEIDAILADGLAGKPLTAEQISKYKTAFMTYCAGEYTRRGWIMQLHYGVLRDNNPATFEKLGPDTGFDCINNYAPAAQLTGFLGALESAGKLPRTIIYSLNPCDNAVIGTVLGCYQKGPDVARIQQGSGWWFNDHLNGMREQMSSLASLGYLAGFVGMLTDSRSFLSYPRHEYFRRILCGLLGEWVEQGLYPADMNALGKIVSDISYNNAVRYFGFTL